jgi:hypothetical protein
MPAKKQLKDVSIRMYRPGLGDCFLLTFRSSNGKAFKLLVDCGVLMGSSGAAERMRLIAQDIQQTTSSHLNAVVATHEHWDHISGFNYARKIFFGSGSDTAGDGKITVDDVWLAWTEDPTDTDVKNILERKKKLSLAVSRAAMAMDADQRKGMNSLLEFSGIFPANGDRLSASDASTGGKLLTAIMDDVRAWSGKTPRYLEPNDVIEDLTEFGIRIYVLAPSRGLRQFTGKKSTGADKGFTRARVNLASAFLAAVMNAASRILGITDAVDENESLSTADLDELKRLSQPFDDALSIPLDKAVDHPYYKDFYSSFYGSVGEGRSAPAWRRIDTDWLQMAETLALQQVSNVNNTSLVLAIELLESKKVILLAGDAEEESWDAWECSHTTLEDLLARVVLYKVAHHGSVNATVIDAKPGKASLHMMKHPELVVMIPVDIARAEDKDWEFPEKHLLAELEAQSKNRVILNCSQNCRDVDPTYPAARFGRGRIKRDTSPERLWVEYTIRG